MAQRWVETVERGGHFVCLAPPVTPRWGRHEGGVGAVSGGADVASRVVALLPGRRVSNSKETLIANERYSEVIINVFFYLKFQCFLSDDGR